MLNYISIKFPLAQKAPERIVSFVLKQNRYAHEIATASFRDWDVQYSNIKPGDPVECLMRGQGTSRKFVGYIHDIKPDIKPGSRFVTVTIIGASYKLKQAHQRVWENTTAPDVVRQIARENNFNVDIEDHPRIYTQIVQPGISDFQLIARLAQQCGYLFRVDNTTIKFKKITTEYNSHRANASTFEMRDANDPKGSTLYSFNLILGESVRYSDAYKSAVQIGGVDPVSNVASIITNPNRLQTIREISNTEFFDSYGTDTVAPDAVTAYYESLSADERNRFPYRASLQVIGAPNLAPGLPVYLDGVDRVYNGYWIILSVEHHIIETSPNVLKYTSFVQVGADSLGAANQLNSTKILRPATIKKRALIPGTKNYPPSNKSSLSKGTNKSGNNFSQITRRAKGSEYVNSTPHIWVFDGTTTKAFVAPSVTSAASRRRKR